MKKLVLSLLLVLVPVTALHAMTVATFLAKADRLEKRGVRALFSSDLGLLKNEVRTAAASLRAERIAAQRAGRPQAYCPPQAGTPMGSRELLAHFRSVPPAQRERTEVRDALRSFMSRKYPCPS